MPNYTSLSVAISAKIMQMQARTNSATITDFGLYPKVASEPETETNVLVWGKSNWGVEKVSSIYKP